MPSGRTSVGTPFSLAASFVEITRRRLHGWNGSRKGGILLDPGCGDGIFLKLLHRSLEETSSWLLWGVEKDSSLAHKALTATSRLTKAPHLRLFTGDFFLGSWKPLDETGAPFQPRPSSFSAVVGNPPYLGFKAQGADLRQRLVEAYGSGFGKSDLSCFAVARSLELLEPGGLMALILPRYWLNGKSGAVVRHLLQQECDRLEIRTWRRGEMFPATGVHILCLWARKRMRRGRSGRLHYVVLPEGRLRGRPLGQRKLSWSSRRGPWPLLLDSEERLLDSLRRLGAPLGEWASPSQGIITGADRTRDGSQGIFVLTEKEVERLDPSPEERRHLHPWIKSRHIEPLHVRPSALFLLQIPPDARWDRLPRLRRHLERHRPRLETRREVRHERIPWWCLQWGRSPGLYRGHRILLPAKAQVVRAAVAPEGIRFSADIYSWAVRNDGPAVRRGVDPRLVAFWLALYLSSGAGRVASRLLGKKMGATVELYPQTQRDVPVPDPGHSGWRELESVMRGVGSKVSSAALRRARAEKVTARILRHLRCSDRAGPDGGIPDAQRP